MDTDKRGFNSTQLSIPFCSTYTRVNPRLVNVLAPFLLIRLAMKFPSLLTARAHRKTRYVLILSLCALWFLAWGAAKLLIVDAPLEHADAIAVLSGSAVIRERAQLAARLYKEGRAPKVILTNDN